MIHFLIVVLAASLLFDCEQEPMQFFPQDQYFLDEKIVSDEYRSEVVVITSPPKQSLELIKAIDIYIKDNYSLEEIAKYRRFSVGFLEESRNVKRVYQERKEYRDYKDGLRSFTSRFNEKDWIASVAWESEGVTDYSYQFLNKYSYGCPWKILIRSSGKKDFRDTERCSKEELQELTDYIDAHWQDLSLMPYRKK